MMTLNSLLLLPLLFWGVLAQCPAPTALLSARGEKLCAHFFERSNIYFDLSCGGTQLDVKDSDDFPLMPTGWRNKVSSLVVADRCTLQVWSRSRKFGSNRSFRAGIVYQLRDIPRGLLRSWNNVIKSYYCTCT